MRLTRTRVFGLCRAIYTDVGERLSSAGYLDDPRQVFCLTVDEIAAFAEGRAVTTRLADVARMRDAEFAEYALEEPPNQFETIGSPYGGRRVEPFEQSADHVGRTAPCAEPDVAREWLRERCGSCCLLLMT